MLDASLSAVLVFAPSRRAIAATEPNVSQMIGGRLPLSTPDAAMHSKIFVKFHI